MKVSYTTVNSLSVSLHYYSLYLKVDYLNYSVKDREHEENLKILLWWLFPGWKFVTTITCNPGQAQAFHTDFSHIS